MWSSRTICTWPNHQPSSCQQSTASPARRTEQLSGPCCTSWQVSILPCSMYVAHRSCVLRWALCDCRLAALVARDVCAQSRPTCPASRPLSASGVKAPCEVIRCTMMWCAAHLPRSARDTSSACRTQISVFDSDDVSGGVQRLHRRRPPAVRKALVLKARHLTVAALSQGGCHHAGPNAATDPFNVSAEWNGPYQT